MKCQVCVRTSHCSLEGMLKFLSQLRKTGSKNTGCLCQTLTEAFVSLFSKDAIGGIVCPD